MKSNSTNQQKWFLAGALVLSLGTTSFIFHPKSSDGAVELSSLSNAWSALWESEPASRTIEIVTADGEVVPVNVLTIEDDNDSVQAIVPGMTEGKVCEDCDKTTLVVGAAFTDNAKDLEVAIIKALKKEGTQVSGDEDNDNKKDEEEKSDLNPILAKILDKCDEEEESERLTCLKDDFLEALDDNRDKETSKLTPEEASKFYRKFIEKELIRRVYEAGKIASSQLRARGLGGDFEDLADYDEDPRSVLIDTLDFVEEFLSEVPSRYTRIRDSLLDAEKKIIGIQADQIARLNRAAQDNSGTPFGLALSQEAMLKQNDLYGYFNTLQFRNERGLNNALYDGNISQLQHSGYLNSLTTLNSNFSTQMTAASSLSSQYQMDLSYIDMLQQRMMADHQRINGTVTVPGGDLSTRSTNFSNLNLTSPALNSWNTPIVQQPSVLLPSNNALGARVSGRGN